LRSAWFVVVMMCTYQRTHEHGQIRPRAGGFRGCLPDRIVPGASSIQRRRSTCNRTSCSSWPTTSATRTFPAAAGEISRRPTLTASPNAACASPRPMPTRQSAPPTRPASRHSLAGLPSGSYVAGFRRLQPAIDTVSLVNKRLEVQIPLAPACLTPNDEAEVAL
jgi:hypothetical protein